MSFLERKVAKQLEALGDHPDSVAWGQLKSQLLSLVRQLEADRRAFSDSMNERRAALARREKQSSRHRTIEDRHRPALAAAGELQRSWAPTESLVEYPDLHVAGHSRAAEHCGGDWWSVYQITEHRVMVVIGDVTGHGIESALLTGVAKGACDVIVRQANPHTVSCAEVLGRLNRPIYDAGGSTLTMTCAVAMFDCAAKTLSFAHAAHPPAYSIRQDPDGRHIEHIGCVGPVLGASPVQTYEERTVEIQGGDTFIWYTDGLIESEDETGRQWGHRRFREAIEGAQLETPDLLRDAIRGQLFWFRGEAALVDDTALIVVRVKDDNDPMDWDAAIDSLFDD